MKIELKERTEENVILYFRMTRDAAIRRFLPQRASTEEEALADFYKTKQAGALSRGRTIYVDSRYVGDIWIYGIQAEEPNAMVSYCIFDKAYHGRGIATAALQMFLAEMAEQLSLRSVGAFTYSANSASIKVLIKNGFEKMDVFFENGVESAYFQKSIG